LLKNILMAQTSHTISAKVGGFSSNPRNLTPQASITSTQR
jgi:hypothetical protein